LKPSGAPEPVLVSLPSFPSFPCIPYIPYKPTATKMATSRFTSVPVLLSTRKLRRIPIVDDGNCFYRAVSTGYYKDVDMHHLLRRTTIEHMLESMDTYSPYFESPKSMLGMLNANKRLGVWNSDLADLVPHAVAQLLNCRIEVYAVTEDDQVIRYSFGEGEKIRLLRKDSHYELLLKN
jgi:hypothetical protein